MDSADGLDVLREGGKGVEDDSKAFWAGQLQVWSYHFLKCRRRQGKQVWGVWEIRNCFDHVKLRDASETSKWRAAQAAEHVGL